MALPDERSGDQDLAARVVGEVLNEGDVPATDVVVTLCTGDRRFALPIAGIIEPGDRLPFRFDIGAPVPDASIRFVASGVAANAGAIAAAPRYLAVTDVVLHPPDDDHGGNAWISCVVTNDSGMTAYNTQVWITVYDPSGRLQDVVLVDLGASHGILLPGEGEEIVIELPSLGGETAGLDVVIRAVGFASENVPPPAITPEPSVAAVARSADAS
jgi:hypothetical protein